MKNDIFKNIIDDWGILLEEPFTPDTNNNVDKDDDIKKKKQKKLGLTWQAFNHYQDKSGNHYEWNDDNKEFIKVMDPADKVRKDTDAEKELTAPEEPEEPGGPSHNVFGTKYGDEKFVFDKEPEKIDVVDPETVLLESGLVDQNNVCNITDRDAKSDFLVSNSPNKKPVFFHFDEDGNNRYDESLNYYYNILFEIERTGKLANITDEQYDLFKDVHRKKCVEDEIDEKFFSQYEGNSINEDGDRIYLPVIKNKNLKSSKSGIQHIVEDVLKRENDELTSYEINDYRDNKVIKIEKIDVQAKIDKIKDNPNIPPDRKELAISSIKEKGSLQKTQLRIGVVLEDIAKKARQNDDLKKSSVLLSIKQKFDWDPTREVETNEGMLGEMAGDNMIVISKNEQDIWAMTEGQEWHDESCMGFTGRMAGYGYWKAVPVDIKQGTMIAYLTSPDDKELLNPKARMLIKPYVNQDDTSDLYWINETNPYRGTQGRSAPETPEGVMLTNTIKEFLKKHQKSPSGGKYKLPRGCYQDGRGTHINLLHTPFNDPKNVDKNIKFLLRNYDREGIEILEDGKININEKGPSTFELNGIVFAEDIPFELKNVNRNIKYRRLNCETIPLPENVKGDMHIYDCEGVNFTEGETDLVEGNLFISGNTNLRMVYGFPQKVVKNLSIEKNNSLQDLLGGTSEVGKNVNIIDNDRLSDLVGFPEVVGGNITISENRSLTKLSGMSIIKCNGDFMLSDNNITNFKGCPLEVDGDFIIKNNVNTKDMEKVFSYMERIRKDVKEYEIVTKLHGREEANRRFANGDEPFRKTSLHNLNGMSEHVRGDVTLLSNPNLLNLNGFSKEVNGDINIKDNLYLKSLHGMPEYVEGMVTINGNKNLTSLDGAPKHIDNIFQVRGGKISSLSNGPDKVYAYEFKTDKGYNKFDSKIDGNNYKDDVNKLFDGFNTQIDSYADFDIQGINEAKSNFETKIKNYNDLIKENTDGLERLLNAFNYKVKADPNPGELNIIKNYLSGGDHGDSTTIMRMDDLKNSAENDGRFYAEIHNFASQALQKSEGFQKSKEADININRVKPGGAKEHVDNEMMRESNELMDKFKKIRKELIRINNEYFPNQKVTEGTKEIINKLLTEWAWRVHKGSPDINNSVHYAHLVDSIHDLGYNYLLEEEDIEQVKKKEKKEKLGLKHTAFNNYEDDSGNPWHWDPVKSDFIKADDVKDKDKKSDDFEKIKDKEKKSKVDEPQRDGPSHNVFGVKSGEEKFVFGDKEDKEYPGETGEYFENDAAFQALPGLAETPEELHNMIENAEVSKLDLLKKDMGEIYNTDINEFDWGDQEAAVDIINQANLERPENEHRNIEGLMSAISNGENIPPSVVVRDRNSNYWVLGGNTRMMAYKALGVIPPVKIIDYDGELGNRYGNLTDTLPRDIEINEVGDYNLSPENLRNWTDERIKNKEDLLRLAGVGGLKGTDGRVKTFVSLRDMGDDSFWFDVNIQQFGNPNNMDITSHSSSRTIILHKNGTISIRNKSIEIKEGAPEGMGTKIFHNQVKHASQMGASYISCTADGSGIGLRDDSDRRNKDGSVSPGMNGFYTWPRMGYEATDEEEFEEAKNTSMLAFTRRYVKNIYGDRHPGANPDDLYNTYKNSVPVPNEIKNARDFKDIMKNEISREWWLNHGTRFEAVFDIKDQAQIAYLDAYAKQKGVI